MPAVVAGPSSLAQFVLAACLACQAAEFLQEHQGRAEDLQDPSDLAQGPSSCLAVAGPAHQPLPAVGVAAVAPVVVAAELVVVAAAAAPVVVAAAGEVAADAGSEVQAGANQDLVAT